MLRRASPLVQLGMRAARSSRPANASSPRFNAFGNGTLRYSASSMSPIAKLNSRTYSSSPYDKIDKQAEKKLAQEKLEARPEEVTVDSTTRHVYEPSPQQPQMKGNVQDGLQHDIGIVKETFQMDDVPREPYALGIAGTLPYMATSISTVYLGWDLNTQWPTGSSILDNIWMNHESASYWLSMLQPIQLGYGAIIISFLGAVHWGMEYTARQPSPNRTKFRYAIGVVAPMVAWPTLLMPYHAALITQFSAFTFLYLADSRATTYGWAPAWYDRYRFILTAIVGAAIFISLVGPEKIGADAPRIGVGLAETKQATAQKSLAEWAKLEEEEKEKNRKAKAEAEKKKKQEEQKGKKQAKSEPKQSEKKDDGEKKDQGQEESESKDKAKGEDKDSGKEKKDEAEKEGNEKKEDGGKSGKEGDGNDGKGKDGQNKGAQ